MRKIWIAMSLNAMKATVMQSWEMLFLFAFNVPDSNCYFQFTTPENSLRLFTSHTGSFFPFYEIYFIYFFTLTLFWMKEIGGQSWYLVLFSYWEWYNNSGLCFVMMIDDDSEPENDGHLNSEWKKNSVKEMATWKVSFPLVGPL